MAPAGTARSLDSYSAALDVRERTLARQLAGAPERWGWQFVETPPPQPYGEAEPRWYQPWPPDLRGLVHRRQQAERRLTKFVLFGAGVFVLGLLIGASASSVVTFLVFLLVAAGLTAIGIGGYRGAAHAVTNAEQTHAAQVAEAGAAFRQYEADYYARQAAWEAAEAQRVASARQHFPLLLSRSATRVDVYGGAGRGWECLLTTMGCTALAEGSTVLCLDFREIAGSLARYAGAAGSAVRLGHGPDVVDGLIARLAPQELAEVLAEAVLAVRSRSEAQASRALDVDLLHAVTRRLDGQPDLRRIVAGLDVLRSAHDDDGPLSPEEVGRLAGAVDVVVGQSERAREELRHLSLELGLLVDDEPVDAGATLWPTGGLSVLTTESDSDWRRAIAERLLVQLVIDDLGRSERRPPHPVLVVVGADDIGRDRVENLARRAARAGVRLVLLFENLRDDARDLVGRADAATIFMRLGNPQDAEAAASFVGRQHRYVLGQISRSVGTTTTRGTSHTSTNGVTEAQSYGQNSGGGFGAGGGHSNHGTSYGESVSISSSESVGSSFSTARAETDGTVIQRSYDFALEPTAFQELSPSCFVLVDVGPTGRRAVAGDCNPALVQAPRLSAHPLAGSER
ncbi:hypothetical protein WCD74_01265 [Actinomycetospora sp. OC33-EN08]|uniref:Uncharacterized protein n=1 Tax=Actinomycetospora aurantiaca TaxID=3129233 RepID=A0ABU8MGC7_9PSEU